MQLTKQAIKEYQEIYFKEHGKKISREEAARQGRKLILFVQTVIKEDDTIEISKKEKGIKSN